ncbi:gliding motility regulatory protein [Geobacter sp. OR-1]|uniref:hybrid sensor histidine kinase/response regulator n=1 Tax=Geobacter sp. OR-1 TaxID=1266765 RepID=UPI0005426168|nr:hybrid sensor histidine kinase/response regulator [Geobacter sp. OR-1]GAM10259.1 gliding motility regulatory protein [Geobacter sp. OR-1]
MVDKDAAFLEHLLATFRVEADEHLRKIFSGLVELEKAAPEQRTEIVETVFRESHSLKGAARSVNLDDVEALCQAMEGVFCAMKSHEIDGSVELFDLMHRAADHLGRILPAAGKALAPEDKAVAASLVSRLEDLTLADDGEPGVSESEAARAGTIVDHSAISPPAAETTPDHLAVNSTATTAPETPASDYRPPIPAMTETVRVSTQKLSSLLLQSEEMLFAKLSATQRIGQMRETRGSFHAWEKEWARVIPVLHQLRSANNKTVPGNRGNGNGTSNELVKLFEFLDWNLDFVKTLESRHVAAMTAAKQDSRTLDGMVNNLLADMKKVLMFPFSSLLEIFPKTVRELARDSGKEADLVISGEEIEIDRRVLEEIKDPLVHLIRNCIDHGIETPGERQAKNKPQRGTIRVAVTPVDSRVEVIVSDDGAGIPLDRVRAALLKLGSLPREKVDELSDQELLPFVFQSGISTSPIITELSGRGLGLAIVREKVEKLGGTVSLETAPGSGTSFRIILPLTVATFHGVLVRLGERIFIIPTMHVERTVRLGRGDIKTVENRETIPLNGEAVSLARLADILGVGRAADPEMIQAIVLTASGMSVAFLVDEVLNEQEVLLKGLGRQLSRVRNVAGVTVIGSGKVVPILNVPDLLKSAVKHSGAAALPAATAETEPAMDRKRSVMVVEDSITTRILLHNIFGAAGYDVVTAVDGLDAFTKLKSAEFDIVVSDVEMPRMNGFDLTSRIRADKRLAEMPVVLVTARESREDRERGIDVGASAYIVKSSFDQSNLLEVVRRLI